jgi:hypothetical protein
MSSARAVCVTEDPSRRLALRRALQAVGAEVDFIDASAIGAYMATNPVSPRFLAIDEAARQQVDLPQLAAQFGQGTKIVMLGASLDEATTVALLRQDQLDHVIADTVEPDETELVVTTVKLMRDDIFGLEKYLAWGVLVRERVISGYEDKRDAMREIAEYAREGGARRHLVRAIETATDELLMNALYDAPAVCFGVNARIGERTRAGLGPLGDQEVMLRYACDGRYFAVSVRDNYGLLTKEALLDNLARARATREPRATIPGQSRGAGLGLYFILSNVTRFVANIDPGKTTEVIGLFDLRRTGRASESCARSLHLFSTRG